MRCMAAQLSPVSSVLANTSLQSHAAIALLQSSSLTNLVQKEIERLILSGTYAPGDKLTEASIAEALGVSRGPVREAFRILEEAGLVRQEKNRGAFVRHIPLEEAMEIFELRAMMDEAVGRSLAQRATPEQLKVLKAQVDKMERLVRAGKADDYALLNLEFHDTLVEFAGNKRLTLLYRKLMNELSLFRRLNLADGKLLPISADEHRGILKAIVSRDADGAGAAMRDHVQASRERTRDNNTPRAAGLPRAAARG
jgi:phosphonate utilization transcriptional regulator